MIWQAHVHLEPAPNIGGRLRDLGVIDLHGDARSGAHVQFVVDERTEYGLITQVDQDLDRVPIIHVCLATKPRIALAEHDRTRATRKRRRAIWAAVVIGGVTAWLSHLAVIDTAHPSRAELSAERQTRAAQEAAEQAQEIEKLKRGEERPEEIQRSRQARATAEAQRRKSEEATRCSVSALFGLVNLPTAQRAGCSEAGQHSAAALSGFPWSGQSIPKPVE
jgi:hypothetical protein